MAKLIPLHIHTEYSLLDGMIRVGDLVKYAVQNELPAIAITDHGVMYSAIEFYEKLYKAQENVVLPYIRHDLLSASFWHIIPFVKNIDSVLMQYAIDNELVCFEEGVNTSCVSMVLLTEKNIGEKLQ